MADTTWTESIKLLIICIFVSLLVIYGNMLLEMRRKTSEEKINEIDNTLRRFNDNIHALKDYLGTDKMSISQANDLCVHLLNTNPFMFSVFYGTKTKIHYNSRDIIDGSTILENTDTSYKALKNLETNKWSEPMYEYIPEELLKAVRPTDDKTSAGASRNQVLYYIVRGDLDSYIIGFTIKFNEVIRTTRNKI